MLGMLPLGLVLAAGTAAAQPAPPAAPTSTPTADTAAPPVAATVVPLSMVDGNFLGQAAADSQADAAIARIAASRAQDDTVRQFAARVATDHDSLAQQAQALAQRQGIQVPNAFSQQQQGAAAQLATRTGGDFDRAYLATQVQAEQQAIGQYQAEINNGTDSAVKQYAQNALPVLQAHLDQARRLQH